MTPLRVLSTWLLFATAVLAQPALVPSLPVTYFLGRGQNSLHAQAVAAGPGGDIWVGGVALGNGLPAVNAYRSEFSPGFCGRITQCPDIFLSRLRADGEGAVFSTYLGDSGAENFGDMALDAEGNLYVTGVAGQDFPFDRELPPDSEGSHRPFVLKMSPAGEIVFAYPLPAQLFPSAIAVDAAGAAFVGGSTVGRVEPIAGLGLRPDQAQVWRSDDGGETWTRRSSGITTPFLEPDPLTAVRVGDGVRLYAHAFHNVFRSDDRGESWRDVSPPIRQQSSSIASLVAAVESVVVLVDCGVFASTDGGESWSRTYSPPNPQTCVSYLAGAPSAPEIVYAAGWFYNGSNDVPIILRSDDGGLSWRQVEAPEADERRFPSGLAVDPEDPEVLYGAYSTPTGTALFRSDDGGVRWRQVFDRTHRAPVADPERPQTLYLIPSSSSDQPALFRSLDRGESWSLVPVPAEPGRPAVLSDVAVSGGSLYVVASEGRAYASRDGGATWSPIGPPAPAFFLETGQADPGVVYAAGVGSPQQGFVLELDPTATRIEYLNLLGGVGQDIVADLALDQENRVFAVGETSSPDFPVTTQIAGGMPGFQSDAFLAVLSPNGDELELSAFLGGSGDESQTRVALDGDRVVLAGTTASRDFPLVNPVSDDPGETDSYWAAAVDWRDARLDFSGYLGRDRASARPALAVDSEGVAYIGGSQSRLSDMGFIRGEEPFVVRLDREGRVLGSDTLVAAAIDAAEPGRIVTAGRGALGIVGPPPDFGLAVQVSAVAFEPNDAPLARLDAIVNAADQAGHPVTPGTVVSLYGVNLASDARAAEPVEGRFPIELAGVRVLIGGRPAPLLYVSPGQINAVTPVDLRGEPLVSVVVESGAAVSNVLTLTSDLAHPAIFSGPDRQALAFDSGGELISESNPARRGEILAVWATGIGAFSPASQDGEVTALEPPFPAAVDLASVRINLAEAEIVYAGAAPGLVAGVAQINLVVPQNAGSGEGSILLQSKDGAFGSTARIWVEP